MKIHSPTFLIHYEVYGMLRNILEKMCNINIRYQNDRHKPCLDL